MTIAVSDLPQPPQPAPLFLLSFRHRDALATSAEKAGWRAIAARRPEGVERRFIASGAVVAVVDTRGSPAEGLAATRALADPVEANAGALLVIVGRNDIGALDALFAAGATHYLASPFGEAEFAQALRFAERHSDRLSGGWHARNRALAESDGGLGWRYAPGMGVTLGEPLRARIGLPTSRADGLMSLYHLLDMEGRAAARTALSRLRQAGTRTTAFAHRLPSGEHVAHHLHIDPAGGVIGSIEPLEMAEEPETRGRRDALTGLRDGIAARRWLETRLKAGTPVTLMLLSVSRFDMINAAFGRETGDGLMRSAARQIERFAMGAGGRTAMVARVAGAEFAIGLEEGEPAERARLLADEIARALTRPFVSGEHMVPLGCRIGMATAQDTGDDVTGLMRRASAALAEAKTGESGTVRTIGGAEAVAVALGSRLEVDLRRALDQREIEIMFQPQISVTTGRIDGVEALARWRHPELGELGASTLFAAAERSDYLLPLSEHIQRRAVALAAAWPERLSTLRLSVNVTAADIAVADFADRFLAMIDESGFPRGRLTVEITESGLIEDLGQAAALLAALRAGGCRVAIDDFGTGYSSLAYLKALPLDYLKIDKKLAEDIEGSSRDRVVVRGVIEMARSLGLSVVAEGVETASQLALLAREGCNYYQGFLCSGPVDSARLAELVDQFG
ncbi:bifunctional diguanylate cyclase/phosphodiesterase [Sphingomonas colocasiae]|uniref:putative bifunctional diguanylate cyclase/phosphodiesterase n=1 Tax=Sphingomonas colocasiae TaxID=1848973 RepID=UPI0031BB3651